LNVWCVNMNPVRIKQFTSRYGGYWRDNILDFCYLTNPFFPSEKTLDSLFAEFRRALKFYPSSQPVVAGYLSEFLGIPAHQLYVSNGGCESIALLNRLCKGPMLIPVPSFNEYENNRRHTGGRVRTFGLREENGFALDVNEYVRETKKLAVRTALVVTPNNPTGTIISKADTYRLMEKTRHLDLLIIDESFINFSFLKEADTSSVLKHLGEFPHVAVLSSMSKDFGIPGLRLGYVASGNQQFIRRMRAYSPIWNINVFAEIFLERLAGLKADFERSRKKVIRCTQRLARDLSTISFLRPRPTFSNFIFAEVRAPFTSTSLTRELLAHHNIFINDTSNKAAMGSRFVRIASRDEQDNAFLVQHLKKLEPGS
jgi:threonine-phosphate decarboxylase